MGPFRIVVRHPSADHHDHAWAHVAGPVDDLEDVAEILADAQARHAEVTDLGSASLPPEQRVKQTPAHRLAEFEALGYEQQVQELVATEWGTDDAGQTVATAHTWQPVADDGPADTEED